MIVYFLLDYNISLFQIIGQEENIDAFWKLHIWTTDTMNRILILMPHSTIFKWLFWIDMVLFYLKGLLWFSKLSIGGSNCGARLKQYFKEKKILVHFCGWICSLVLLRLYYTHTVYASWVQVLYCDMSLVFTAPNTMSSTNVTELVIWE